MKKFYYFLLTLFFLLCTTFESKAFTVTIKNHLITQHSNDLNSEIQYNNLQNLSVFNNNFEFGELSFPSTDSVDFLGSNLTILSSLCIALVLFNLVAQVKIIYQMIHLFFLFRKKDEFASFEF